jgi:hypothetical protein
MQNRYKVSKPSDDAPTLTRVLSLLRSETGTGPAGGMKVGYCRPTPDQELLLKTLFLPDAEQARVAWREWRGHNDPEHMDVPSMRLVPELYRRLRELGVDDVWMPRFKGSYKKTWTNNQRLLLASLPAIKLLDEAGISTVALKGFALSLKYLRGDFGLRSMFDLDLLIPTRRVFDAIDALVESDWRLNSVYPIAYLKQRLVLVEHAREFVLDLGHADLHWHMLHQDPSDTIDDWVRKGASRFEFRGYRFAMPSASALLFHVCLHGVRHCSIPSVMWAADALTILRGARRDVDFDALIALAQRRRLVLPILDSFSVLSTIVPGAVPADVLERLRGSITSRIEEIEYGALVCAPEACTEVQTAAMDYMVLLRRRHAEVDPEALLATPASPNGRRPARYQKQALTRVLGVRSRW